MTEIIVALIAATASLGGIILTAKTRRENQDQHGTSQAKVAELTSAVLSLVGGDERLHEQLDTVEEKVDTLAEEVVDIGGRVLDLEQREGV